MDPILSMLALLVSIAAAGIAVLSWRAAVQANKAAIFEQRFSVYRDAEEFVASWVQLGVPDIQNKLRTLVDAWNRSHFLFDEEVTAYLRRLWLDGLEADLAQKIIAGECKGDHQAAVKTKYDLFRVHCADVSPLRQAFVKHMKV